MCVYIHICVYTCNFFTFPNFECQRGYNTSDPYFFTVFPVKKSSWPKTFRGEYLSNYLENDYQLTGVSLCSAVVEVYFWMFIAQAFMTGDVISSGALLRSVIKLFKLGRLPVGSELHSDLLYRTFVRFVSYRRKKINLELYLSKFWTVFF